MTKVRNNRSTGKDEYDRGRAQNQTAREKLPPGVLLATVRCLSAMVGDVWWVKECLAPFATRSSKMRLRFGASGRRRRDSQPTRVRHA